MRIRFKDGNELHEVIYIDYQNGIPHQVHTTHFIATADEPYWRLYEWDFFANEGDKTDIRAYQSGSGGTKNEIRAPQWADGYIGEYWVAPGIVLNGTVENGKQLTNPKRIKGWSTSSINPFKIAEITYSCEYCDRCGHSSTEYCKNHIYEDEKGDLRYFDNDETI